MANNLRLKILLNGAYSAQEVNDILSEVGHFQCWESKRAYLEGFANIDIGDVPEGESEENFWAIAETFILTRKRNLELDLLIQVATSVEQIDEALTKIGGFITWEEKRKYLEKLADTKILVHTGDDKDSFIAVAENIITAWICKKDLYIRSFFLNSSHTQL